MELDEGQTDSLTVYTRPQFQNAKFTANQREGTYCQNSLTKCILGQGQYEKRNANMKYSKSKHKRKGTGLKSSPSSHDEPSDIRGEWVIILLALGPWWNISLHCPGWLFLGWSLTNSLGLQLHPWPLIGQCPPMLGSHWPKISKPPPFLRWPGWDSW